MKTFASLFSGFGGADIGAMAAGLAPIWGVEFDAKIAAVANQNLGEHIKVANILDCNPAKFASVDALHASPPCPNFSVAKAGGEETDLDLALARKVAEFVAVIQPRIFTLENVWGYRNSKSWAIIRDALDRAGYWYDITHVNSADFGVPQTRKRMIVRAIRGAFVPCLPGPEPWIGWLAAIADLVDELPETEFAPWQLERLPADLKNMLVSNAKTEFSDGLRSDAERGLSVTTQAEGRLRAHLVTQQSANATGAPQCRPEEEPANTITATTKGDVKAFLVGKNQDKFGDGLRLSSELAQTIGANEHGSRAFIVDGQKAGDPASGRNLTIRQEGEPVYTMTSSILPKRPSRANIAGKVVAMTPRCLARFQSFPDWYELPANRTLAAKGIGNAVPPLLMEKIYRQLLEY